MAEPQIKFVLDLEDNLTTNLDKIKMEFASTSERVKQTTNDVLDFTKALGGTTLLVGSITALASAFTKLQEAAQSPLGQAGLEFLNTSARSALTELKPLTLLFSDLAKTSGNFIDGFTNGITPKAVSKFRQNSEALITGTVNVLANRISKAQLGTKLIASITNGFEKGVVKALPTIDKGINKINEAVEKKLLKPGKQGFEQVRRIVTGRATAVLEDEPRQLNQSGLSANLTRQVKNTLSGFRANIQPFISNFADTVVVDELAVSLNQLLVDSFKKAGAKRVTAIADTIDNLQLEINNKLRSFTQNTLDFLTSPNERDQGVPSLVNTILGDDLKLTKTKIILQSILSSEGSELRKILEVPLNLLTQNVGEDLAKVVGRGLAPAGASIVEAIGIETAVTAAFQNLGGTAVTSSIASSLSKVVGKSIGGVLASGIEKVIRNGLQKGASALLGDLQEIVDANADGVLQVLDGLFGGKASAFLRVGISRLNEFVDSSLEKIALAGFDLASLLTSDSIGGSDLTKNLIAFARQIQEITLDIDEELGGILTSFGEEFVNSNLNAIASGTVDFLREKFLEITDELEAQITGIAITISEIPSRIQSILDPISDSALYLTGATEPIELFQDLTNASVQLAQGIFAASQQLTFLKAGLDALRSFVANSPFQGLIDQNARLRETILATRAALAATSTVSVNGAQTNNALDSIRLLQEPVQQAIKELREGSLDLVGVTSDELIPVFQIVAQNAVEVGASLKDAKDLTLAFSASLGTLGIPLFQARQEINSILQGQVTINSALAKTLNLTNAQINSYKTQGTLVKELQQRLSAFTGGNALAAREFAGVTSNIAELFQEINRVAGEPIFDLILDQVNKFYEFLKENRQIITVTFTEVLETVFEGITAFVDGLTRLKDSFFNIFGTLPQFLASSFKSILTAISNGLTLLATLVAPVARIFAELASFAGVVGGNLFQLGITLKVLSGAVSVVSTAFSGLVKIIPIAGEILFFLEIRTTGLIGQFLNLSSAVGRGAAGFLLLAQNLQRIPFLQGQVADSLTQLLGGIPLLGNALTAMLPSIGSFGITLVGLAKAFPPFGEVLQNIFRILPGGIKSLGTLVSLTPVISPFGAVIQEVGNKLEFFAQKGDLAQFVTRQFDQQVKAAGVAFQQFFAKTLLTGGGLFFLVIFFDELILKNEALKEIISIVVNKIREFAQFIGESLKSPLFVGLLVLLLEITGVLPRILQIANAVANQIGQIGSNAIVNSLRRLIGLITGIGDAFVGVGKAILPAKKSIQEISTSGLGDNARELAKLQDERKKIQDERKKIKDELSQLATKSTTTQLTPDEIERSLILERDLEQNSKQLNRIEDEIDKRTEQGIKKKQVEAEADLAEVQLKVDGFDRQIDDAKKKVADAEQALKDVEAKQIDRSAEAKNLMAVTQQEKQQVDAKLAPIIVARDKAIADSTDTSLTPLQNLEAKIQAEDLQKEIDVLSSKAFGLQDKQLAQQALVDGNTNLLDTALGIKTTGQKPIDQAITDSRNELLVTKRTNINQQIDKLKEASNNVSKSIENSLIAQATTLSKFGSDIQNNTRFQNASLRDKARLLDAEVFNTIERKRKEIESLQELRKLAIQNNDIQALQGADLSIARKNQEIIDLSNLQIDNQQIQADLKDIPSKENAINERIKILQEQLQNLALTPDDLNNAIAQIDAEIAQAPDPQAVVKLQEKRRDLLLTQADVEAEASFNQAKQAEIQAKQADVTDAKKELATAEVNKGFEQQNVVNAQNKVEKLQQQLLLKRLQMARSEIAFSQEELARVTTEIERINRRIANGTAVKADLVALNNLNRERAVLQEQEVIAQRKAISIEQEITGGITDKAGKSKAVEDLEKQRADAQNRLEQAQSLVSDASSQADKDQALGVVQAEQKLIDQLTEQISQLTLDEQLELGKQQQLKADALSTENLLLQDEIRKKQTRIGQIKNTPSLVNDPTAQAELATLEEEVGNLRTTISANQKQIDTLERSADRNRIVTLQVKRTEIQQRIIQLQRQLALIQEEPDTAGKVEAISATEKQIADLKQQEKALQDKIDGNDVPFKEKVATEFEAAEKARIEALKDEAAQLAQTRNLDLDAVDRRSANDKALQRRRAERRARNGRGFFGRLRTFAGDLADGARNLVGAPIPGVNPADTPNAQQLEAQAAADAQDAVDQRIQQLNNRQGRGRNVLRDFLGNTRNRLRRRISRRRTARAKRLTRELQQIEADEQDLQNIQDPQEQERARKDIAERRRRNTIRRNRGLKLTPFQVFGEFATDTFTNATKTVQNGLATISNGFKNFIASPLQAFKNGLANLGNTLKQTFSNGLNLVRNFGITLDQGLFLAKKGIAGFVAGVKGAVVNLATTIGSVAGTLLASFAPMLAFTAAFAVVADGIAFVTKTNDLFNKSLEETNEALKNQKENLVLNAKLRKAFLDDRSQILESELDVLTAKGEGESDRAKAIKERIRKIKAASDNNKQDGQFSEQELQNRREDARSRNMALGIALSTASIIPEVMNGIATLDLGKIGNTARQFKDAQEQIANVEFMRSLEGIKASLVQLRASKVELKELTEEVATLRNELLSTTDNARKVAIEAEIKSKEEIASNIKSAINFDQQLADAAKRVLTQDQAKELQELVAIINKDKQEIDNISQTVLDNIKLTVAGSDVTQLQNQAKRAIEAIDKSFLEGLGDAELLNERVDFFTKNVIQLVELRQLTEEESIRTLERIAANPFLATEKAQAGLDALNKLSQRLLERRTEDIKLIEQQNRQLVAEGRVDLLDVITLFTENDLEIADLQLQEFVKRRENVLQSLSQALEKEKEFRRQEARRNLAVVDRQISASQTTVEREALIKRRKEIEEELNRQILQAEDATQKKRLELQRAFALEEAQIQQKRLEERAKIFQAEIKQTEDELERLNKLRRNALEEQNALRILELKKKELGGEIVSEEVARAEAEIEAERTANVVEEAKKRLNALIDIQSRATGLSKEAQEQIQQQIADARIAVIKAVSDAVQAEDKLVEAFVAESTAKLKRFERSTTIEIERQNVKLAEQKQIADQLNQSLDRRKKLLEEAKSAFDSQQKLMDTEIEIIQSDPFASEFEKQEIAQQTANIKIESALLEIQLQKESLKIEQEQQRIALARRDIENEIAQAKAEVELLTKQNELAVAQARLQADPDDIEKQLAVREAELAVSSALLQRQALQAEKQFIDEDRARLEQQFAIQNQNQANQERIARLTAAQQIVSAAEAARDPNATILREQLLANIRQNGGLSPERLLANRSQQSLSAILNNGGFTSAVASIDPRLANASDAVRSVITPPSTTEPSAPIVRTEKLADGTVKETVELLTSITETIKDAKGQIISMRSMGKPKDQTTAESIIGDRLAVAPKSEPSAPIVRTEKLADGTVKETVELLTSITETIRDAKGQIISIKSVGKPKNVNQPTRDDPTIATPTDLIRDIGRQAEALNERRISKSTTEPILPPLSQPNPTIADQALLDAKAKEEQALEAERRRLADVERYRPLLEEQLNNAKQQLDKLGGIEKLLEGIASLNPVTAILAKLSGLTNQKVDTTTTSNTKAPSNGVNALQNGNLVSRSQAFVNEQLGQLAIFSPSNANSLLNQVTNTVSGVIPATNRPTNNATAPALNNIVARSAPINNGTTEAPRNAGNTINVENKITVKVGEAINNNTGRKIGIDAAAEIQRTISEASKLIGLR